MTEESFQDPSLRSRSRGTSATDAGTVAFAAGGGYSEQQGRAVGVRSATAACGGS